MPASGPPLSPDVMAQQMPPMAAFADQGQQMMGGGAPADPMAADPTAFAKSELDKIAASLMNVAKVLSQSRKELMPLVQKMAEAGSMLTNELQTNNADAAGAPPQDGGQPAGPPKGENPGDMALGA